MGGTQPYQRQKMCDLAGAKTRLARRLSNVHAAIVPQIPGAYDSFPRDAAAGSGLLPVYDDVDNLLLDSNCNRGLAFAAMVTYTVFDESSSTCLASMPFVAVQRTHESVFMVGEQAWHCTRAGDLSARL
jgi:hypothetical protein